MNLLAMLLKEQLRETKHEKEIREASSTLEVVEDYPKDKYTPSCLLLGFTLNNRVLHIQVSKMDSDTTKIITLYEPEANQWINYRRRKN